MKKIVKYFSLFITLTFISCGGNKDIHKENCIENLDFKNEFFKNLSFLDTYYEKDMVPIDSTDSFEQKVDKLMKRKEDYHNALNFFSNYPKIKYKYNSNYNGEIPYYHYLIEKKRWLLWYEENKCKNIQFKSSYIIPEAYKE